MLVSDSSSSRAWRLACHVVWLLCRLKDWLDTLLWEKGSPTQDIYRMKGLLRVAGSHHAHVLQAVHELYDVVPGVAWSALPAKQQQHNKVVLIGRNLDVLALQEGFDKTTNAA